MDIKERVIIDQQKKFENFKMCTRDFESVRLEEIYSKDLYHSKVKQLDLTYIEPYMIYTIFVRLLEFNHTYKPMEKILFEIPFKYKNIYGVFSMDKFGLNLSITTNEEELLKDLFEKLNSAGKIAESLLKPFITEAIGNGEITIENQTGILRQRYLYFRKRVKEIYDEIEDNEDYPAGSIVGGLNRKINLEKEIIFNTQAMLDAYFSFQEHLLILLLPFTKIDYRAEPIPRIINSNWSDKFKKIFDINNNRNLLPYYEELKKLKEIRNKYAHGGFEKEAGSLFAHIKGVGAIPIEVPSQPNEIFSFVLIRDVNYKEICEGIDKFEEYLYNSEWKRAIKIVEFITDMRFDAEYISELKRAITSDGNLEYFLEKESYIYERTANMDW
ncbi:hypothetical protein [Rossellomorea marisflavi]|uniref:hypothetical protein n=1 Tax=Rossellomorea marisflavi TaxID=189381 RepID=UPI003D2ED053